jgi:hypothetical protein
MGYATTQTAIATWPDAVAELAGERTKAETCAALAKRYGNYAQTARAELSYSNAKADSDAVIAGLITALSGGQTLETLPVLQAKLSGSVSGLIEFCDTVSNLLPNTAGQKGIADEIAKAAIEPLLKELSDAVKTLYNNYRGDAAAALTRRTIQTQLEAARWAPFSEINASDQ